MPIQFSTPVRNGQLNSIESSVGTGPKLQLRSGAKPANCASAEAGTLLSEIALPSDWMETAASGAKVKKGDWSGTGTAAGVVGHFRVVDNAGTTCHLQGAVSLSGGGGDMTLDNTNVQPAQSVTVNSFNITSGNA